MDDQLRLQDVTRNKTKYKCLYCSFVFSGLCDKSHFSSACKWTLIVVVIKQRYRYIILPP